MTPGEDLSTEPYKGVRDFYPADWRRMTAMFTGVRRVLESHGFEEFQASPLEHSELYESKGNEEIIREQTFSFIDRGERRVTLRPEMTPTLARMVAGKRRELAFPLRWFSIGNRFRYERPQKGRLREFYQTDVDLVGLPEGEADLEIIAMASEILKSFGATDDDFVIRINSRKLIRLASEAVGLPEGEVSRAYWQLVDRKAKMSAEEFAAARKEFTADPLAEIERANEGAVAEEKARVKALVDMLKERGVSNAVFDTDIVRGFDYYTGTVFEVSDTNPENPRALFGGGRYDGLVSMFGGEAVPAVGFAFGDVTMMDFLDTHGLALTTGSQADVYIATPSPENRGDAESFARALRADGVRVFVNLTEKGLGDQIKDADKRSIPYVIVYGADEVSATSVTVKTLSTGDEEVIEKDSVAPRLRS
ncbi:MAG: histidine--tRNA ligase [Candidatus Pacebacteria bacterium]|nr:histidine--tRNA ligase [Candidatus Paceibacterota bacterium]MBP9840665.1 histidine--tRNA ligase [Candidatus Paceibacterota bacterium]